MAETALLMWQLREFGDMLQRTVIWPFKALESRSDAVEVRNFRNLQNSRLRALESRLTHEEILYGLIPENDREALQAYTANCNIDQLLHTYTDAVRDFEFLSKNTSIPEAPEDPYPVFPKPESAVEKVWYFIKLCDYAYQHSRVFWKWVSENSGSSFGEWLRTKAETTEDEESRIGSNLPSKGPRCQLRRLSPQTAAKTDNIIAISWRLFAGVCGGLLLLGPVILMTLKPGIVTSLVTVSVSTLIFILVTAIVARGASPKDVLMATSAYVAVLVVFIGAGLQLGHEAG